MHLASTTSNIILLADDTSLFYSHKDIEVLFKMLNEELDKINERFLSNHISLNADKTNFLHKPRKASNFLILLNLLCVLVCIVSLLN